MPTSFKIDKKNKSKVKDSKIPEINKLRCFDQVDKKKKLKK